MKKRFSPGKTAAAVLIGMAVAVVPAMLALRPAAPAPRPVPVLEAIDADLRRTLLRENAYGHSSPLARLAEFHCAACHRTDESWNRALPGFAAMSERERAQALRRAMAQAAMPPDPVHRRLLSQRLESFAP